MIKLSPSILAADFAILGEQMRLVEQGGTDYFHFDVMDGVFVPNISFGIPVLVSLRKITQKVLDIHLMIERPERYIQKFADAGADIITFHLEATEFPTKVIDMIHEQGCLAGISIKPGTPVEDLAPFLGLADMFLIMTVEPGFGGQTYMDFCTEKVRKLRAMLDEKGLSTDIQVDGGVTRDNIETVLDAGANVIVMGSSVFKGDIRENARYFTELFHQKGE